AGELAGAGHVDTGGVAVAVGAAEGDQGVERGAVAGVEVVGDVAAPGDALGACGGAVAGADLVEETVGCGGDGDAVGAGPVGVERPFAPRCDGAGGDDPARVAADVDGRVRAGVGHVAGAFGQPGVNAAGGGDGPDGVNDA